MEGCPRGDIPRDSREMEGRDPEVLGGLLFPRTHCGRGPRGCHPALRAPPPPSTYRLLSSRMGPQRVRSMAGPGRARLMLCTSWS